MQKFEMCASRSTAKKRNPWACIIAKVCGGYMCFEHQNDYKTWKAQR